MSRNLKHLVASSVQSELCHVELPLLKHLKTCGNGKGIGEVCMSESETTQMEGRRVKRICFRQGILFAVNAADCLTPEYTRKFKH